MPDSDFPPLSAVVFQILLAMAEGHEHGYAIGKSVAEISGLVLGPGTLYGSLQRMERDGLVRETVGRDDDRRKPFAMTARGRKVLEVEAARIDRLAALVRSRHLVPGSGA